MAHDHARGDPRRAGRGRPVRAGRPARTPRTGRQRFGPPAPARVLDLQRSAGNRAVAGLLAAGGAAGTDGAVVQRDCVARGDAPAVRALLRPAAQAALEAVLADPDAALGPVLVAAVAKALGGHADAAQQARGEDRAREVAAVRETVTVGVAPEEYDVTTVLAALDGLHRNATGLEGVAVSAGLRETVRVLAADVAATVADTVLAAPSSGLSLAKVRGDVIVAGTAAGDATALLRLELEGTISELVEQRTAFGAAGDEDARAEAGEAIGRSSRQALLLNKLLIEATKKGGTGATPLDTAVDARAADISRMRETALSETDTAKELGDDVTLLGEQQVGIRHGEDRGDVVEPLGEHDTATVLPEQALPEATDEAEVRWAEELGDRVRQQRDEVKDLRGRIVPESPAYTLAEFAGVHKRWYAFYSHAQEQQDPNVQLALGLLGEPYKMLGTDVGKTAVAAEAGIARGMLMNMAVDVLARNLGGGESSQFGSEIARRGPRRVSSVTGTSGDAQYRYGEMYPTSGARAGGRAGEITSRTDLAGERATTTAALFSMVSTMPARFQAAAARGAGLTPGDDLPLVGMRKVEAREGWSYLVDVYDEPTRDVKVAREHKVMPPEVADYLLARQQQVRTLEQVHVPRVGGFTIRGRPAGGTPLGSASTRGGGVEQATATSSERYLDGEAAPAVPKAVRDLQSLLAEQRTATGTRSGHGAPSSRPESVVSALTADLRAYQNAFFAERQDVAWRLAAIFHIANEEHHVGAQLMKLLEAGTIAEMIKEAVKISAIMMALQALGPLGTIAGAGYAAYLRSQGVADVTALISIAAFCHSAADADSLDRARAWAYVARNVADDAAELFENMVTSPVTAGMHVLTDAPPRSPRELADSIAPLLADPTARAAVMADVNARIATLETAQSRSGPPGAELAGLLAFRDGLLGRSTPETAKAAESALPGAVSDARIETLTAPHRRSALDVGAMQAALMDLAPHVPVVESSTLTGNAVHVRYNDAGGLRVEIGPQAQPAHVRRHVETVRALRRYEGAMGRVLTVLSRARQFVTGHPAYGTKGFENQLEVRKLRSIIAEMEVDRRAVEAKADRLTGSAAVDLRAEAAAIRKDVDALEAQLVGHEADLASYAAGRGFVAAEDTGPAPSAGAVTRAKALVARAQAAATVVRPAIEGAVAAHGGTLAGLAYEIKTEESLARKINDRASERGTQTAKSLDKAAGKINDALRYTAVFEGAHYTEAYAATRKTLEGAGYTFVRAGDAWTTPERFGGGYRGINATFRTKDGLEFELQFHTPESWAMKQETHALYEEQRDPRTKPERVKEIEAEQRRLWATVPYPEGLTPPGSTP